MTPKTPTDEELIRAADTLWEGANVVIEGLNPKRQIDAQTDIVSKDEMDYMINFVRSFDMWDGDITEEFLEKKLESLCRSAMKAPELKLTTRYKEKREEILKALSGMLQMCREIPQIEVSAVLDVIKANSPNPVRPSERTDDQLAKLLGFSIEAVREARKRFTR